VAAFDLDGTVIKSSYVEVGWRRAAAAGGGKQQNRVMKKRLASGLEWEWWRAVVPQKLKEAHDSGYALSYPSLRPSRASNPMSSWEQY
jgi:beta-phosphoglucomutase-like phosphatase (HAD superfamily)